MFLEQPSVLLQVEGRCPSDRAHGLVVCQRFDIGRGFLSRRPFCTGPAYEIRMGQRIGSRSGRRKGSQRAGETDRGGPSVATDRGASRCAVRVGESDRRPDACAAGRKRGVLHTRYFAATRRRRPCVPRAGIRFVSRLSAQQPLGRFNTKTRNYLRITPIRAFTAPINGHRCKMTLTSGLMPVSPESPRNALQQFPSRRRSSRERDRPGVGT